MDNLFTIEDWKLIIINFLAIQNKRIEFPNWKWVATQLNIYVKCEICLRDNLKHWYGQYRHSTKFPPKPLHLPHKLLPPKSKTGFGSKIKTKTVSDINKNQIEIILPPTIKNKKPFNLEQEKTVHEKKNKQLYLENHQVKWT